MILAASSTTTVAIISAAAALSGAVIGALAAGLVEAWLERRERRRRTRAAARLVQGDLVMVANTVGTMIDHETWYPWFHFDIPSWERGSELLAGALDPEAWDRVARAVYEYTTLEQSSVERSPHAEGEPLPLGPQELARLTDLRDITLPAFNALTGLAENEEATVLWAPPGSISNPRLRGDDLGTDKPHTPDHSHPPDVAGEDGEPPASPGQ